MTSYSTVSAPSSPWTGIFQHRPLRFSVLGAGFAGLSVTWHLLKHSPEEIDLHVDIYDESGIGGGASGVSGGLIHPYSPKARVLWRGAECWSECLKLLSMAEATVKPNDVNLETDVEELAYIVRRRGILKPAMNAKTLTILKNNAQNCLASCRIETIDKGAVQDLVPNLSIPLNTAFYMPEAVNVHSERYLKALFLACQNLAKEKQSVAGFGRMTQLSLRRKSVHTLLQLEGEYDAVIVCLGAKANFLPELSGRLPLRTCRGVVAHLQLPHNVGESYPDMGPSILSDAWLAVQGPRSLYMGSTWEWRSRNSSPEVSSDELSEAIEELESKVSSIFPAIKDWTVAGARAGLRAMPPLTPLGSLPLLGCINEIVSSKKDATCKYWLLGGLGSRGLLYHGWLGKLTAQAVLSCDEGVIPFELTSWKKRRENS